MPNDEIAKDDNCIIIDGQLIDSNGVRVPIELFSHITLTIKEDVDA